MATKEELSERITRVETKIDGFRDDISRIETNLNHLGKEVYGYIDKRCREMFQLCLQEYNKNVNENRKSTRAISLSKRHLIVAIIGVLVLVVVIILQWKGIL